MARRGGVSAMLVSTSLQHFKQRELSDRYGGESEKRKARVSVHLWSGAEGAGCARSAMHGDRPTLRDLLRSCRSFYVASRDDLRHVRTIVPES